MQARTRRWSVVASWALAVSLLATSGAVAAEPSADDPVATVNGFLDTLVAKDFQGIAPFVCLEKRDEVVQRFDLQTAFAGMGEGVDVEALFAGLTISTRNRTVTVKQQDGSTAIVAVTGSIEIDVDDSVARAFVEQLLTAQGQDVTDEMLDQFTPLFVSQVEASQDLTRDVTVILEGGVWLLCDDFGDAVPGASAEPSSGPEASMAPMDAAAWETLLQAIPDEIEPFCEPDQFWQVPDLGPEPGEIASADCDPDDTGGDFVSYSLFDSADTMNAFYDVQLLGQSNMGNLEGPGCPEGPGESTWDGGRRFCYAFLDDANMRWTHDRLFIVANAIRDDGDWAALEAFFQTAGPVAP